MAAIDDLPFQLRPAVRIAALAPGVDRGEYLRALTLALYGRALANGEASGSGAADMSVPTPEALARSISPDAARRLTVLSRLLQQTLDAALPASPDPVRATYVSCLEAPIESFPRGTVVYVRVTENATIEYLLPHLVADFEAGVAHVVNLPQAPKILPEPRIMPMGAINPEGPLSVVSTLAWILPPPWGAIASAGITLFGLIVSNMKDAPSGASDSIKKYLELHDVSRVATQIKGFSDYIVVQRSVLEVPLDSQKTYVRKVLLPKLRAMTTPGGESVYDGVHGLVDYLGQANEAGRKTALDLLVQGVSLQLLALKMIMQLDALVAAQEVADGRDAAAAEWTNVWLDDYVSFHAAVNGVAAGANPGTATPGLVEQGWAKFVGNAIDRQVTDRMNKISKETFRYDREYGVGSGRWVVTKHELGWTFKDAGAEHKAYEKDAEELAHFVPDTVTSPATCCAAATTVEHKDVADKALVAYTALIKAELDLAYASSRATVRGWSDAIAEWSQHLPPPKPTTAPTIAALPQGQATPQGTGWVEGGQVQYAIGFTNNAAPPPTPPPRGTRQPHGPSGMGPASASLTIGATAFARLSNLPVDPYQMATHRQVYRRFFAPNGAATDWRIIKVVAIDSTVSTYDDTDAIHV